jgi:hypothetical protein
MDEAGKEEFINAIPEMEWEVYTDESGNPLATAYYRPIGLNLGRAGWNITSDSIETPSVNGGHKIVLTWEFLKQFCIKSKEEIAMVLGHELAHHVLYRERVLAELAAKLQRQIKERGPIIFQDSMIRYTVKSGDTLTEIGKNTLKTDDSSRIKEWIKKLVAINRHSDSWRGEDKLEIGQTLLLPPIELSLEDAYEIATSQRSDAGESIFDTRMLIMDDEAKADLIAQLYVSKMQGMSLQNTRGMAEMLAGWYSGQPLLEGKDQHPVLPARFNELEQGAERINRIKELLEKCNDGDEAACQALEPQIGSAD